MKTVWMNTAEIARTMSLLGNWVKNVVSVKKTTTKFIVFVSYSLGGNICVLMWGLYRPFLALDTAHCRVLGSSVARSLMLPINFLPTADWVWSIVEFRAIFQHFYFHFWSRNTRFFVQIWRSELENVWIFLILKEFGMKTRFFHWLSVFIDRTIYMTSPSNQKRS